MLYAAVYTVLRVYLTMMALSPHAYHARDLELRWALAEAVVEATEDPAEQDTLTAIAFYESAFRPDVARCDVRGDHGRSLGLFQIQPIENRDRALACGSLSDQAALALQYVRRSAEACPSNVGADTLAMYVSGRCTRGLPEARHRWGGK